MIASTACFITANDSDAGKTFLTTLLLRQLQQRDVDVIALKPVACGVEADGINDDVARLHALQPHQPCINLHTTAKPVAPLFDQPIARAALLPWCQLQRARHRITLFEGVGGMMVPLADGFTQLDWMLAMPRMETVLVVRARLGCLSQLLTHLTLLDRLNHHHIWLVVNAITQADVPFAEQCLQVVNQWFPQVRVEMLTPDAQTSPALIRWLLRPLN